MRVIDADKLKPDCMSKDGRFAISQSQIANAKSIQTSDDAVSRKAVHDMLENLPITVEDKWFNWLQKACMRLAELPPVTPTHKSYYQLTKEAAERM